MQAVKSRSIQQKKGTGKLGLKFIPDCKLSALKLYDRNPRLNDLAVEAVSKSIAAFGFISPIIIDQDYQICAGHTRYKAAIHLRLKTVPVISVSTELYVNGKRRHRRSIGVVYGTSAVVTLRARGVRATCITTKPKHRYLFPLDAAMRAQIANLAQSYPKRVGSIDADARGFQPREGGSSPTPTLQNEAACAH